MARQRSVPCHRVAAPTVCVPPLHSQPLTILRDSASPCAPRLMRFLRVIRLLLALLSNGVFATLVVEVSCSGAWLAVEAGCSIAWRAARTPWRLAGTAATRGFVRQRGLPPAWTAWDAVTWLQSSGHRCPASGPCSHTAPWPPPCLQTPYLKWLRNQHLMSMLYMLYLIAVVVNFLGCLWCAHCAALRLALLPHMPINLGDRLLAHLRRAAAVVLLLGRGARAVHAGRV